MSRASRVSKVGRTGRRVARMRAMTAPLSEGGRWAPGRTAPVENRARAGAKGREPLAACCLSGCRLPSTPLTTSDRVRGQGKTRTAVAGPFAGNGEGEALPRGVAFEKTARHLPVNVPAPGAACASRQPARPREQPAEGAGAVSDDPSPCGREGTVRTSASQPSRHAPQVLAASVGLQLLSLGSQARRAVDVPATRPASAEQSLLRTRSQAGPAADRA